MTKLRDIGTTNEKLNISLSRNISMTKLYCHICKEGGRECVEVSERSELLFVKTHLRCHLCGRPLVG